MSAEAFQPKQQAELEAAGGRIVIEIDEAELQAALSLHPNDSNLPFRIEEIGRLLQKLKVTRGVDEGEIQTAIGAAQGEPISRAIIARGRPPVKGRDAYLEYPILDRIPKSSADPTDPARFCEVRIVNVHAEETVAIYHPLVEGTPGMTVRGRPLGVPAYVDNTPKPAEHVRWEDRNLVADVDGRMVLTERQIKVEDVLRFDEDLTVVFGDVDFIGKVEVGRNIEGGVTVTCRKGLEVKGSIIGSSIRCFGDLIVGNGITGSEETNIEVHGRLETLFVENADLRVWGCCNIKDSYVTSELLCAERFEMIEGRGHFVSGVATARSGIVVRSVGIPVGTKAKLAVGKDLLAREQVERLEAELERAEKQLADIKEIDEKVGPMTKAYQKLPPRKQEEIELLLEQIPRVEDQVNEFRGEIATLQERLRPAFDATITVQGDVNVDTVIEFPLDRTRVDKALTGVTFRYNDTSAKVEQTAA